MQQCMLHCPCSILSRRKHQQLTDQDTAGCATSCVLNVLPAGMTPSYDTSFNIEFQDSITAGVQSSGLQRESYL